MKRNAKLVLVQLYAIKLTNFCVIMDGTISAAHIDNMQNYEKIEIGGHTYQKDIVRNSFAADAFLKPVFKALAGKKRIADNIFLSSPAPDDKCRGPLLTLLKNAKEQNIIDDEMMINDAKAFKTEVLAKCKLPCFMSTSDYSINPIGDDANRELFHSLADVDLPHLMHEQIQQIYNEPFYRHYQIFQNGIVINPGLLRSAIVDLRYLPFTNYNEIQNAVGTDGMSLCRQMANRMAERVKKS